MAVISIVIPISRPSVQMARTLEVPAAEWLFSPSIIARWPLLRMVLFIFPRESILGRFVWPFYVPSLWPWINGGRLWQQWSGALMWVSCTPLFFGRHLSDATAVVVVSFLSYWYWHGQHLIFPNEAKISFMSPRIKTHSCRRRVFSPTKAEVWSAHCLGHCGPAMGFLQPLWIYAEIRLHYGGLGEVGILRVWSGIAMHEL